MFAGRRAWSVLPLALVTVLGVCALYVTLPAGELSAAQRVARVGTNDQDQDGLPDAQEVVIGSDAWFADTDGDGFGDLEEFARQSDFTSDTSLPTRDAISAAISARGENPTLRLFVAIFQAPESAGHLDLRLGMLAHGRMFSIPSSYIAQHSVSRNVATPSGQITILDMAISTNLLVDGRNVSCFVYAFDKYDFTRRSAAVVDIFSIDGVPAVRIPPRMPPGASMAQQLAGSIYRPIPPAGEAGIPPTWTPGQICMRTAMTVGVDGAILTQEVTRADCTPEWDAYCGNNCGAAIGSTYQTIDPVVLVGN